jgi:hypothetical protein
MNNGVPLPKAARIFSNRAHDTGPTVTENKAATE